MKRKALSWIGYILIGIAIQCVATIHMCHVRGFIAIGGELLILPLMIVVRATIEDFLEEWRDSNEQF